MKGVDRVRLLQYFNGAAIVILARCAAIMKGAGHEHSAAGSIKKLELCWINIELLLID
jgi:hypothetical protein